MSSVEQSLAELGMTLPQPPAALGDYVPATRAGALVFTSGQLPMRDGELLATGSVGGPVSIEVAQECARVAALNALAAASTVCDLDEVAEIIKLVCYVASGDTFTSQPAVANAASAVMVGAFGDAGRHAREAVGVARLPLDAPVELSLVLLLR